MPEVIEQAIYGGLTEADQLSAGEADPDRFPERSKRSGAIAWGFEQGVFEVINHARNAYDVVKRECQPKTAAEMWELWIADVLARKAEKAKPPAVRGLQTHEQPSLNAAPRPRTDDRRPADRVFQPLLLRPAQLGKPLHTELVPSEILFQMVLICLCLIM